MKTEHNIAFISPRPELGNRAEARNKEVQRALNLGADRIFTIDQDETMPSNGLEKLMKLDCDVAVIDAPPKGKEGTNVTYNPDGTLAYTGVNCALIKSEVFSVIPYPWFESHYGMNHEGIKNGKIILKRVEKYQDDNRGEDSNFILKCLSAGLTVKIVPNLQCKHV